MRKNTKIYHQCCLRCGRKLRKLEHKERGYGDVCWRKMKLNREKPLF